MVLVRFLTDKQEWIVVDQENKQDGDLYIDGKLKQKLDKGKLDIKRDFDVGGIIAGGEGTGKSTFASNIMLYMTNTKFDPRTDIIKSHEDALEVLEKVPDGGGVMFDEGYLLFYSADVLTKNQKMITKIFSIIRQKNLFFLIVAPSFFRLSTYFALDRTRFMMRVYDVAGERGYFGYWGEKRKDKLFRFGKSKHSYKVVGPAFRGRFTKCSLLDEAYKELKRQTLAEAFAEARVAKKKTPTETDLKRKILKRIIENNGDHKRADMARILGISEATLYKYQKEIREKKEQIYTMEHPVASTTQE